MPKTKPRKAPNPTDQHVGTRIRMRRIMLGMSQSSLAHSVNISFQQVQKYERGTNRVSASRMQQFSRLLDVPVSFFFEGSPEAQLVGAPKSASKAGPSTPPYVADFLGSREGHAIMKAFHRIADRKLRLKMVALAEELAGLRGGIN